MSKAGRGQRLVRAFRIASVLWSLSLPLMGLSWTHMAEFRGSSSLPLRLSASEPFSEIECMWLDPSQYRFVHEKAARTIWKATCTDGSDCMREIEYGARRANITTAVEPEELGWTNVNECYACFARTPSGVRFRSFAFEIDSKGDLTRCTRDVY
jgi:hypothetical protein